MNETVKKKIQYKLGNQLKLFNTEYFAYQFIINYPVKFFLCYVRLTNTLLFTSPVTFISRFSIERRVSLSAVRVWASFNSALCTFSILAIYDMVDALMCIAYFYVVWLMLSVELSPYYGLAESPVWFCLDVRPISVEMISETVGLLCALKMLHEVSQK